MYTTENESSFVKEALWEPNSTFVFCGQKGVTWHSYESSETTNRITLNYFLMSAKRGKRFIQKKHNWLQWRFVEMCHAI